MRGDGVNDRWIVDTTLTYTGIPKTTLGVNVVFAGEENEPNLVPTRGRDTDLGRDRRVRAAPAVDFLSAHGVNARGRPVATALSAADVILDVLREADARLLVMGTYGSHPLDELFFGSVARTVLEEAKIPIFLYQ